MLSYMAPGPGKRFIDATGGPGNMSRALLEASGPDGRVLTIDCDPRALAEQERILAGFGERSVRRRANFARLGQVAAEEGFIPAQGVLYDLGVSSRMLDGPEYGASIRYDSRLDMRMDPDIDRTAFDLVNGLSEGELGELFRRAGERRFARRIARAIVRAREKGPVETTGRLAALIAEAVPRRFHPRNIHVATRPFNALRVEVNKEPESLEASLRQCPEVLAPNGVLVVICYSSTEDRVLRAVIASQAGQWRRLTRKAVRAGDEEVARNPRSRSARLRAYRKVG
jgi:16S rRNA (cytosine1402-N4)-methyltransferase